MAGTFPETSPEMKQAEEEILGRVFGTLEGRTPFPKGALPANPALFLKKWGEAGEDYLGLWLSEEKDEKKRREGLKALAQYRKEQTQALSL